MLIYALVYCYIASGGVTDPNSHCRMIHGPFQTLEQCDKMRKTIDPTGKGLYHATVRCLSKRIETWQ